jgi:hypothetical protein
MSDERMTEEEMAEEARRWAEGESPPGGLVDAPDAVPRAKESVLISIRLPRQMVEILKEFAKRAGVGYQVLMKRWLDERIQQEHEHLRRELARRQRIIKLNSPTFISEPAAFDASSVSDLTVRAANVGTRATGT